MLTKTNAMKMFFGFLMLTLMAAPKLSYADWSIGVGVGDRDEHHDHWRDHHDDWRERERERQFFYYHDHPDYGYRMHYLPGGSIEIWVAGVRYYYFDGLYYVRDGFDYELVTPPVGAYVGAIPPDFQPVSINGSVYYANNGVYYVLTDHGYRLVPQPVVYAQPEQAIVTQPPANNQGSFTVNVPNNSGGYTAVVVTRSGNGYVGPQGEFYATFPTVAQLRAMYGK